MMWESIFLFCFGIYLLISFYLIKFKKKLFLMIFGNTYKKIKYAINRSKLEGELSFIAFVFGIIFIIFSIIRIFKSTLFIDYTISIIFIVFICNMFVIIKNINSGNYK